MTVASDHTLAGDTRREEVRPRHQPSRLTWRRHRYWILTILGLLLGAHLASGIYIVGTDERAVVRRFGAVEAEVGPGMHYRFPWPVDRLDVVGEVGDLGGAVGRVADDRDRRRVRR